MATSETIAENVFDVYNKEKDQGKKYAVSRHAFEWWSSLDFKEDALTAGVYPEAGFIEGRIPQQMLKDDEKSYLENDTSFRIPAVDMIYKKAKGEFKGFESTEKGVESTKKMHETVWILFKTILFNRAAVVFPVDSVQENPGQDYYATFNLLIRDASLQANVGAANEKFKILASAFSRAVPADPPKYHKQLSTELVRFVEDYTANLGKKGVSEYVTLKAVEVAPEAKMPPATEQITSLQEEIKTLKQKMKTQKKETEGSITILSNRISEFKGIVESFVGNLIDAEAASFSKSELANILDKEGFIPYAAPEIKELKTK